jgi:phosphoribosyl-ATP pyrophosphohydrolase
MSNKINNINEKIHKEAFEALVAISEKYGIDVITITDEDIYNALLRAKDEGVAEAEPMLARLNPKVCKKIRDEFNERLCEHWFSCLEDAINNQIYSDDDEQDAVNTEAESDADVDSEADSEGNEVKE